MAALNVTFPCEIGSGVVIQLSKIHGRVKAWMLDEDGVKTAWVRYSDTNKAIHTEWMRASEIGL